MRSFRTLAQVVSISSAVLLNTTSVQAATVAAPQVVILDRQMIALINDVRAVNHLPAMTEAAGLTVVATYWSNQVNSGATGFELAHNPNAWAQVALNGASNRTTWGENVASAPATATSTSLFLDYMSSPDHRAAILSTSYRYIGSGTVRGSHGLWNTLEFTDQIMPGQALTQTALGLLVTGLSYRGAAWEVAGNSPSCRDLALHDTVLKTQGTDWEYGINSIEGSTYCNYASMSCLNSAGVTTHTWNTRLPVDHKPADCQRIGVVHFKRV